MLPNRHPLVLAISLAALPLAQSHAQNAGTAQLPTTVISASALAQSATQMVSASEVLEGSQLLLQRQATLGDTVKNIPGVRGSSFGAGASRPVIRGMCQWPLLLIHFRPLKLTHLRSGFIHFLLQSIAFTSKHKYV